MEVLEDAERAGIRHALVLTAGFGETGPEGRMLEARVAATARKHGIQSTIHTGGPSIPGSGLIDKDVVLEADADVIGHINGGHTSLPEAHVCELCEKSSRAIEIVHNGNEKVAIAAAQAALQLKCPHRVILGTDGPAGSGVQPLGILRMIALLSSLADIPAEIVIGYRYGMGPTVPVTLRWGTTPRDTLLGTVRVVFDSLTPYPAVPGPLLPQDRYTAWLSFKQ